MAKSLEAQLAIIKRLEEQTGKRIRQVDAIDFSSAANAYSVSGDSITGLSINGCEQLDLSPVAELTELKRLDLYKNKLGDVAPLANLNQLTSLVLRFNQISDLVPLENLTQLTSPELSSNQISDPAPLRNLTQLTALVLDSNQISDLAPLQNLNQLTSLYLASNQISDLAPLENLTQLASLGLQSNLIRDLAPLEDLRQLEYLNVSDCPQLNLPPEIVEKRDSPQEILDYWLRSRTQPARPLNEAKLLVVGEAEVGKTSLIKRLRGQDFDPNEDQTHGIRTHRWDLALDDRTVRLNVWDFGSQEIMHATHQFFLTRRSLYLLVLDSRQNERQSRIEYWLKLIHSFGEDSPVIVVCNKCDQQTMQLDWKGLQVKYPQIKAFVRRVSCYQNKETGEDRSEGLDTVHNAITQEIAHLEHVDTPFPETWFAVKQELEDSSESCLLYSSYVELCEGKGIVEEKEQRQLIGSLHNLGIVLHFHDHPILRDLNILNPLWVTTAVYRILTSKHLSAAHGVLTFGELDSLLKAVAGEAFEYPTGRQMFLIEMMRRFELLFDFEGQANVKFLVPGLLPLEQPEGIDADWADSLGFRYDYEVLPASVMSRFIVRMHQRIYGEIYWRKGVVLESLDGDVQARVQADFEDAQIDIRIRGQVAGRRRFLQSIRDQFDAIHSTIPRLAVTEQVPLPEHPSVLVDYKRLLLFESKGKTIDYEQVGDDLIEVNVNDLLKGIRHPAGLDVFISYAHADAPWLERFNTMLKPLVREGRVTPWSDQDIGTSHNWREEIDRALHMAKSGLLLVSPHFLASDFIMKYELPYLLRAREDGRARIVIALLSDGFWDETPLQEIQAAHDVSRPLDTFDESALNPIVKSICRELMQRD